MNTPIVIERLVNAPVTKVWQALTSTQQMKDWYFDIASFKPEVGFEFQFYGGKEDNRYLHLCKVTEVIPQKKMSYTWKYERDPQTTVVSFELFPEGNQTRIKLTHEGVEGFAADNPDLKKENFVEGWTMIIGKSLKEYVEDRD